MTAQLKPLEGIKVLSLGGIGPVPFAAMLLADLGAEITRLETPAGLSETEQALHGIIFRDQPARTTDLKDPDDLVAVRDMIATSDVLLEGFRPGVAERLGVGPQDCHAINPGLIYGRMTGWGQDGPLAHSPGHDINYIAISGLLEPIAGSDGTPVPPMNLLGDFAGGSMYLVAGVLSSLYRRDNRTYGTGEGVVIDAAIVDGVAHHSAMLHSMRAAGHWDGGRAGNLLDGGAPFYQIYKTSDDKWMSAGAIEPKFYANLLQGLGLSESFSAKDQYDQSQWPLLREKFAEAFVSKSRQQWVEIFHDLEACVFEVVAADEVVDHPHLSARGSYTDARGFIEPTTAPRIYPAQ